MNVRICALTLLLNVIFPSVVFAQTEALVVDEDGYVGVGTSAPVEKFSVYEGAIEVRADYGASDSVVKLRNSGLEFDRPTGNWGYISALNDTSGLYIATGGTNRIKIEKTGGVYFLGQTGASAGDACFSTTGLIYRCTSSKDFKNNIQNFEQGLSTVKKLRPVTFDWKDPEYGTKDVGFVAEEVAAIEPLLATYGKDGKVTGVQYSKVATVLVNAIKAQQTQLEAQGKQIAELQELVGKKLKASGVAEAAK